MRERRDEKEIAKTMYRELTVNNENTKLLKTRWLHLVNTVGKVKDVTTWRLLCAQGLECLELDWIDGGPL